MRRILLACLFLLGCDTALATAQRTFVASTGSDANPCSITLPCRGFAAALANTTSGGEIVVQDSAGYGAVVIDRSVKIIAPAGVYAGITAGAGVTGVTINDAGIDVALIGLSLNGLPGNHGIYFQQGASLLVDRCVVSGFGNYGILLGSPASRTTVRDTITRDNGLSGLATFDLTTQTQSLDVARVHVEGNQWGIMLGRGTLAQIDRTVVINNPIWGLWLHVQSTGPATTQMTVTRSRIAQNYYGLGIDIVAAGGGGPVDAWIVDCEITEQLSYGAQLYAADNVFNFVRATFVNNRITGNGDAGLLVNKAGTGTAAAVLTGNTITRNATYGVNNFNGVVRTAQNNTIDSNVTADTTGTLTTFVAK